jgi:hypothetical protein
MLKKEDLEPLFHYQKRVIDDPLRLSILAAHALLEELIELVIAEAVPHSECFEVPKMQFWKKVHIIRALVKVELPSEGDAVLWECIEKLTSLRNAAAHKDYDKLRDQRFTDMEKFLKPDPSRAGHREIILEEATEVCAGMLLAMRSRFRNLRQGSPEADIPVSEEVKEFRDKYQNRTG